MRSLLEKTKTEVRYLLRYCPGHNKITSAILSNPAIAVADDRRRSLKIEPYSAIVYDCLRSIAIERSYGNQSFAICDQKLSHNILNSNP